MDSVIKKKVWSQSYVLDNKYNEISYLFYYKFVSLSQYYRLQNWGGIPHPNGMVPEVIPQVKYYPLYLFLFFLHS